MPLCLYMTASIHFFPRCVVHKKTSFSFFRSVVRTRSIFPGEKKMCARHTSAPGSTKVVGQKERRGDGFLHPPSEKGEERRRCIASLALSALARRKRRRKMHREETPPSSKNPLSFSLRSNKGESRFSTYFDGSLPKVQESIEEMPH